MPPGITELKRLFIKIYEDNAKGNLNDERYEMMSQNYEAEQKQLEAEVVALRHEIEVQETLRDIYIPMWYVLKYSWALSQILCKSQNRAK